MSDKHNLNSRPSNSLLSYSTRKLRPHSLEQPLPKRSRGLRPSSRRESYLDSREESSSSLWKQQNDQIESSSSYPRELLDQFRSSDCELCNVQFSAPIMSKMHYCGKKHMKKVRHFMEWWSLRTGNPMLTNKESDSSTNVPIPEYCELCDIEMLTINEKILHISGKKHKKNLNNPTKCRKRALHCSEMVKQVDGSWEIVQTTEVSSKKAYNGKGTSKRFECKLCGIMVSSEDNLVAHCNGIKHNERLEYKGFKTNKAHPESSSSLTCTPCKMSFESEQDMEKHKQTNKHKLSLLNQDVGDRVIPGLELWYCMTCKAQYKDSKEYIDHLFGDKHMTLEMNCSSLGNNTDLFYCTVCDLHVDPEGKDGHVKDLEHRRKSIKNYSINLITKMANTDDNTLYYSCPDCPDAGSMNFFAFNTHLLTYAHTDKVLKRKSP